MLSKAVCLTLVKFVLAESPPDQLMVLGGVSKALKQVEKVLQGFLWSDREAAIATLAAVGCASQPNLEVWASQTSLGWQLASRSGGSGGCAPTHFGLVMGWTCSSRKMSMGYSRHRPRWRLATESWHSWRTGGWMEIHPRDCA